MASAGLLKTSPPNSIVAMMVTAYVSKRSAAIPAQSPTLSPTLSAITAGFLGSSSGIPASIFPTRSAPTSAPFVKIPPPNLAKIEMSDPPNAKPISACRLSSTDTPVDLRIKKYPLIPRRPRPTTRRPVTAPPRNATDKAAFIP